MNRVLILTPVLLACTLALAQAPRDPSSGSNMLAKSSSPDATFLKQLAEGDLAEVDAGRLATQKSTNQKVKEFGEQMVRDHSKNDTELQALAASQGVQVPTTIDSTHAAEKSKLEEASGDRFDEDYIEAQIRAHEKTVQLLQRAIHDSGDAAVKQFAEKTLPVVEHHLTMAHQVQATLPKTVAERANQSQ